MQVFSWNTILESIIIKMIIRSSSRKISQMHLCFFVLDLHQFIYDEMKAFLFLDGQKVKFLKYYHNVSDKFYRIQRGERQRTNI